MWGRVWSEGSSGSNGTHCSWQRLDDVGGTSAVIDKLEMDSVYVLRVRGCNKAGFGEYSEEVYLHTPPAPGKTYPYSNAQITFKYQLFRDSLISLKLPSFLTLLNFILILYPFHLFYFFNLQFSSLLRLISFVHSFICL